MNTRISRGTVTIDRDACKGCEICVKACPPDVLFMSREVNEAGYHYPVLVEGCTGCGACREICPDYVFEIFRFSSNESSMATGAQA
jgi:2-oxoglutarate ferredoxin oxidoreductase subunit delta